MKKIMKRLLAFVIVFISVVMCTSVANAEFNDYKHWSKMKPGDVIYFDTTNYNWENVYLYIWEQNTLENYTSWENSPQMQPVEGKDNLYKFVVTDDMGEKYDMIIFQNGLGGSDNQTIDIGFIEDGFVYKLKENEVDANGCHKGYWYLYDNSDIINHLNNVKSYKDDKEYYTSESYGNLDELIAQAVTESEQEMVLFSRQVDNHDTNDYYMQIELTLSNIDDIIDNLVVDKSKLQDLIDEIENDQNNIENTYTPSTVQALFDEVDNQKQILNGDVTVDDIKDGIDALNDAKDALVEKADKTALNELLDEISQLNEDDYTPSTFSDMNNTKAGAQDILDNQEITQDEVDNFVTQLRGKVDALVRRADKTALNELLDEIAQLNENNYTEESFNDMNNTKAGAQEILDNQNITQDEVDDYVDQLREKVDSLVRKTNSNSTSNKESNTNNNVDTPKTLDNIVKIVVIFVVSALLLVGLIVVKKKVSKK